MGYQGIAINDMCEKDKIEGLQCALRNGSQKNSNAKVKMVWVEKSKVTNLQGPKKIWVLTT